MMLILTGKGCTFILDIIPKQALADRIANLIDEHPRSSSASQEWDTSTASEWDTETASEWVPDMDEASGTDIEYDNTGEASDAKSVRETGSAPSNDALLAKTVKRISAASDVSEKRNDAEIRGSKATSISMGKKTARTSGIAGTAKVHIASRRLKQRSRAHKKTAIMPISSDFHQSAATTYDLGEDYLPLFRDDSD